MNLGWWLLIIVLILILIMVWSGFYFRFWLERAALRPINELDQIRTTLLPPYSWQKRSLRRWQKHGRTDPAQWERQKRRYLRKLDKVVKFAKKTAYVEDEETRQCVLRELTEIRDGWKYMNPPI